MKIAPLHMRRRIVKLVMVPLPGPQPQLLPETSQWKSLLHTQENCELATRHSLQMVGHRVCTALSESLYAAPSLDASQSCLVRGGSAVPVGLQCSHVGSVALQLDNLVTTPRHVKVGSEGPLAHTPIPNGALASLAHALHFALTPIGLTGHRTEVFLHLDANVVRSLIVIPGVYAVPVTCETC